ncbi:MAG: aminoacyl-tRNA hydrolase [Magnetococcales bacterium]|nr:aminoacyl-tRNA hydrolase [Magnetococcales bacterium]
MIDLSSIVYREIHLDFVRASGPGGQNVNKVSSAVQLRFDVRRSPSLPQRVRERLEMLAGKRLTDEGVLILEAQRFRTQERNRQDAIERLLALLEKAQERPEPRIATRPSLASKLKRLEGKKHRAGLKEGRRVSRQEPGD